MATKPARISLAQPIQSRSANFSTDSYTQNVIFEETTEGKVVIKRPGLNALYNVGTTSPAGFQWVSVDSFFVYNDYALTQTQKQYYYAFATDTNSNQYVICFNPDASLSATAFNFGASGPFQRPAGFCEIPYTGSGVATSGGTTSSHTANQSYVYAMSKNSAVYFFQMVNNGTGTPMLFKTILGYSPITLDTKTLCNGIEYLDGYIFVATTTGQIYNTDLLNLSPSTPYATQSGTSYTNAIVPNFTTTSFLQVYGEAGPLVGLTKHLNYLIAFKAFSCEFFYNAGNPTGPSTPGSPLANYLQARATVGCVNWFSIQKLQETVVWIGQGVNTGKGIYMFNGLVPQQISNSYIDKYLDSDGCLDVTSYTIKWQGHKLYVLNLNTINVTLAYDILHQAWYRFTSYTAGAQAKFWPVSSVYGANYPLLCGISNRTGAVTSFKFDPATYQDDGLPITVTIQTDTEDWGTRQPKIFGRLDLVADQTAGSSINISHSDDDFITYSTPRSIDLSQNRPVLFQGGRARKRAYRLDHTANTSFRGEAIELDIKGGS